MGYRVVWSPKAVEDVETIAAYIARDSVSYAAAVVEKILDMTQSLGKGASPGCVVLEFGDETVREVLAYSHRIIYQVQDETVTIAAVIHTKKLLELDMKL